MSQTKKDYFVAKAVVEKEGVPWPRIGAAFANDNGTMMLKLDAMPIGGRIYLEPAKNQERGDKKEVANG